ncbi:unnamed protein product [Adineta ricciae]|uniref:G-protein coupled receptors family 1 profile domain-containing protein n=1 Tax=Adineta ricciae TaxID=249248 RepID=A0A815F4I0_ADIRI|nr:unnamed protein product [Adineta ricciae]CAF1375219.1 unnamed protein product [Adineta ricciae]
MSILSSLFQIAGIILLAIGSLSCILNLIVFTSNSLRKNPCAMCFVGISTVDLLYLYLGLLPTILQSGFNINPGTSNIVFCRCFYYVDFILSILGPTYLIITSIERTLVTSRNAGIRKRSTRRLVLLCLISSILFWALFQIHIFIYINIIQIAPNYFLCYYQAGLYTAFITFYSLFIVGITPPVLMGIFGFLTLRNIRQVSQVRHHSHTSIIETIAAGRPHAIHSKDRQLIRIVFMEIMIYLISRFPSTIFLIYQQITQHETKSDAQISIEQFIANITYFTGFIDSSISCYANILISKNFRTELKRIFRCR